MKRSVTYLIAILAVVISIPAFAATKTANLAVSATVVNNCLITTAPVAFGNYDPVVANAATDLYANGSVTVTCTKSAPNVWVDLGPGLNFSGTRRMISGANFLNYELYKADPNPTPGALWTTGNGTGGVNVTPSGVATPNVLTVFGRVPQAQDAAAGTYNDTVVATVNY